MSMTFGEGLIVERTVSSDFPSLCDGNRIVKIVQKESLPYFLTVCGFECRIWYREQPPQCFVCRELGHRAHAYACPLSGLCHRCRRPGHKCMPAWDPSPAAASGESLSTSVPVDPVLNVLPGSVDVASVPSSAMIYPVSITVDEPLAVDSVPANVASVPAPVVVDPAPIIVDEPLVVPANTPVSDPVLVTEPVSPVPDVPVTATNISVEPSVPVFSEPPPVTRTQDLPSAIPPDASLSKSGLLGPDVPVPPTSYSAASISSGSKLRFLGPSVVDLFRKSLIVHPRDCGDPCGFERALESMSLVLPKVKRSAFLKMSSSDTNKLILNTLLESGCNKEISGLIGRFLIALVKVKTHLRTEELTLDI